MHTFWTTRINDVTTLIDAGLARGRSRRVAIVRRSGGAGVERRAKASLPARVAGAAKALNIYVPSDGAKYLLAFAVRATSAVVTIIDLALFDIVLGG